MIGFEFPRYAEDAPIFWQNFREIRIKEVIKMTDKVRNEFEVIEFAIAPYNAKIFVTMTDGTVRDFSQDFFSISMLEIDKFFLSFETETDMIYFKMEWS